MTLSYYVGQMFWPYSERNLGMALGKEQEQGVKTVYICVSWHLDFVQDVDVVRPFCPSLELLQLDEISDPFS